MDSMANKKVQVDKKVKLLSIDAEFSSFDMVGGDLLSLGVVEILEDNTLGRKGEWFFRPRSAMYFTEGARKVHGISYFKAETFPERRESIVSFLKWMAPLMDQFPMKTAYWGSWNFDLRWINYTMTDLEMADSFKKAFCQVKESHFNVLHAAKKKLKHIEAPLGKFNTEKEKEKGKYTLSNVAKFYGIEFDHHNALSDAIATAKIYIKLEENENVWTGELF